MKKTLLVCASVLAAASSALAQTTVFDNGPFITQTGVGANGADISRAESSVITIGFNENATTAQGGPIRIADDFVLSSAGPMATTQLRSMTFYATQSNSVTTNVQFTAFYVAIYSGDPASGGTLVAGDFTTNRLISSEFTNVYRVSSTGTATGATRPVIALNVDMSWTPRLGNGAHWMVVSAVGDTTLSATPNPQAIFVTPHSPAANAWQFFNGGWIFIWDPAFKLTAFCKADYDKSGSATVQDIFALLNDWFAGSANADINGADGLSVSDIFDFLNVWFAGC